MSDDKPLVRRAIDAFREPTPAAPRVRRARTFMLVIEAEGLVGYNYLNNTAEDCSPLAVEILQAADEWIDPGALVAGRDRAAIDEAARLLGIGYLVVEGTTAARHDETFDREWEWDVRAGLLHLSSKDPEFMTLTEQLDDMEQRIEETEVVPMYTTNAGLETVVALPKPDLDAGVFPVLKKRRTIRTFDETPIRLEVLSECLYAGLAITELGSEPVKGMGPVPIKMTPSGGARNPFEGYVMVRRVAGLAPGFYHYSAIDQTLGLVAGPPLPTPSELTCGQDWWDGAGALVFLVANFKRTMWKYPHPLTFKAVQIEAGHIGQNIMILATQHGLTAGPTLLVRDSQIEAILGLDHVMQSVTYVLSIGVPSAERGVLPPEAIRRLMA